jgi:hypothetical protein
MAEKSFIQGQGETAARIVLKWLGDCRIARGRAIGASVVEALVSHFLLIFFFELYFRLFPVIPIALWI